MGEGGGGLGNPPRKQGSDGGAKRYTDMLGKGKGGRGRSAQNRTKSPGLSGGVAQQKPTLKGFWTCKRGGLFADKNFGWRPRCVACDALRPKKATQYTSENVGHMSVNGLGAGRLASGLPRKR